MMKFNAEGLVSEVRPIIQRSIKELEEAKSKSSQIQAPSGFPCQADLSAIPNEISAICDQIRSIDSWIGEKADSLSGAESANKGVLEKVNAALSTPMPSGLLGKVWLFASDMGWLGDDSKKVANKIEDISRRTKASITNGTISFIKGAFKGMEHIGDGCAIIGTIITTPFTWIADLATGNTSNSESFTNKLWNNTMAYVADEKVENVYKDYLNTKVGQALDNDAYAPFKSNGTASKWIEEAGENAAPIAVSILFGKEAGSAVAGITGFGRSAEQQWGSQKAEYEYIKNLSNEEWAQMQSEYEKGNISKADFERMQEVRNSDDWRTEENRTRGLIYGTANGLWEGAQWAAGAELSGMSFTSSGLKDAFIRVGIDTVINTMDPIFRTYIDAATSDRNVNESWEAQGGIKSVITSAVIGLTGSAWGEAFSGIKQVRQDKINVANMNDKLVTAKNMMNDYFSKNPILGIEENGVNDAFNKIIIAKNDKEFVKIARKLEADPFCSAFYNNQQDKIILRNNNTLQTVIHEVNHSLGNVFDPWLEVRTGARTRGINEAITDRLAFNIAEESFFDSSGRPKTGYIDNVVHLDRMVNLLEKAGYSNVDSMSYYTYGTTHLGNTLNRLTGRSDFYDDIVKNMDIADGWGTVKDKNDILKANIKLSELISELEEKIGG